MNTTLLLAIIAAFACLLGLEARHQHNHRRRLRTRAPDLLRDTLERWLPIHVEHQLGPHIFVLGFYFGERSHDLWLCLPFFMARITFKPR